MFIRIRGVYIYEVRKSKSSSITEFPNKISEENNNVNEILENIE